MAREWFEIRFRDGLAQYGHARTGLTLARRPGMTEEEWTLARAEFFDRFPRAREIRDEGGAVVGTVDRVPRGEAPVFMPGDRLVLRRRGSRPGRSTVSAIQMPLPGCGDPSYLLGDGRMLSWSGRDDGWVIDRSGFREPAAVATRPTRGRDRSAALVRSGPTEEVASLPAPG